MREGRAGGRRRMWRNGMARLYWEIGTECPSSPLSDVVACAVDWKSTVLDLPGFRLPMANRRIDDPPSSPLRGLAGAVLGEDSIRLERLRLWYRKN